MQTPETRKTILLIGASRGLGHAMAVEFLQHGWNVVGTVRDKNKPTLLHDLVRQYGGRVNIEELDTCDALQLETLHNRLTGKVFEIAVC